MSTPENEIPLKFSGQQAGQDRILWLESKHKESVARCLSLEKQLEGVSSALMIAHRDLDAANAKLFHLKGRAVCLYCQKEFEYRTAAGQEALADHICTCEKNPMLKGCKDISALCDELYALVEAYLCTPNTEPIIEDHYKALVAWFVRHKRPDGTEPRPVAL